MDDLEFRRRLYSNPNSNDQDIIDTIEHDRSRKKFADELIALDVDIEAALKVDVPENLANQLILRQSLHSHQQTKKKSRIHLAMAASVAFIVGVAVSFLNASPAYTDVADYSLAHYYHEADNFNNLGNSQYTLASFNEDVNGMHVNFTEKLGRLVSLDDCFFDGMDSIHMVLEGKYDNITVFIIPKSTHLKFTDNFNDNNIKGITRQYKQGDIVIMGNKKESLVKWQKKIDETISWSI